MPGSGHKEYPCVLCSKRTKPNDRRHVKKPMKKFLRKHFMLECKSEDVICSKCRHNYYTKINESQKQKAEKRQIQASPELSDIKRRRENPNGSPPSVTLPIPCTSNSHAYCFLCKKPGPKLVVVPTDARYRAFIDTDVIIPAKTRCCPSHLQDGLITIDALTNITKLSDNSFVNRSTIMELIKGLREMALKNESQRLNFDGPLSNSDYIEMTGISKENFDDLCTCVSDSIRNTPVRSKRTTIGIFLFKLKSGMSNKLMSTLFNISTSSLRRALTSARLALIQSFVPDNLGFQHISRSSIIETHTRPLAQSLFSSIGANQAIIVLDGTYIYIQKSNNFKFQRRSFSMHKGRPLVKPMVVVSTTGYFIAILGPYLADGKNNDAAILQHMLKTNVENIKEWVEEDDIFVVDRGFRDAIDLLDELGVNAKMPSFLTRGQKQLSTEDANSSRLVTKVRWVVESANARIKRWKYLDHVLPTNQVPNIGDYVRIVCSICNKYLPPLSKGSEDDEVIAAKMLYLSSCVNELKNRVELEGLEKKKVIWKKTDDEMLNDFPRLDEESLRNITCGTYQLKLSPSYMQEHLDGDCDIQVHKDDSSLLRVRLQSRHTSSKTYLLWIQYSSCYVEAWYCKCRSGSRVVGVCAHIAAVIWYLGYARHLTEFPDGVKNWSEHVLDAANVPEIIDNSDTDSHTSDTSYIEE